MYMKCILYFLILNRDVEKKNNFKLVNVVIIMCLNIVFVVVYLFDIGNGY